MFELHPQLEVDTYLLGDLPLSLVLLSKDANYPWCLLVPKREGLKEIHQLNPEDRIQLMVESCTLSEAMAKTFTPIKMNVAALGNMVPQLHLHHIARYEDDPAWPGPIWGKVEAKKYPLEEYQQRAEGLQAELLKSGLGFTQA